MPLRRSRRSRRRARFAPCGWPCRCGSTAGSTKRSTATSRRSPTSSRSSREEGAPATEKTELWIAFDDDNVYVVVPLLGDATGSRGRERDAPRQRQHLAGRRHRRVRLRHLLRPAQRLRVHAQLDRRPAGRADRERAAVERRLEPDLGLQRRQRSTAAGRSETAIPFKSLRYRPGESQVWGFNARRTNRWKNEMSFLAPIAKARGQRGLLQASLAAHARRPRGAAGLEEPRDQAVRRSRTRPATATPTPRIVERRRPATSAST